MANKQPASLLEKARKVPLNKKDRRVSPAGLEQQIELAMAWAKGTVGGKQVCEVLGFETTGRGSLYCWLATTLAKAVKNGQLVSDSGHR